MIQIRNLSKSFGKNEVLKGLDLDIGKGGISAILGPNGSGKTTLIKSVLGLVIPDSGSITFQEQEIIGQWQYREEIGYLPQIARFPENLKVRELIEMVKDLRGGTTDEQELIEIFKLRPFENKTLRNLSGGTRQKVNIILAFMYDNPLLILDEPTVGLDPVALIRLKGIIKKEKEKGTTILITTHIMNFVEEVSDEIVFLLEGHIYYQGTLETMKEKYGHSSTLEQSIAHILEAEKI